MRGSLGEVQIRRRTAGRSILDEHENDLLEQAINSNSAAIRDLLLGRLLESFCYQVVDQSRRCGVLWPPFSRLPSISADEVVFVGDSECKVDDYCQPVQLPPTYLFSKSHRGPRLPFHPASENLNAFRVIDGTSQRNKNIDALEVRCLKTSPCMSWKWCIYPIPASLNSQSEARSCAS